MALRDFTYKRIKLHKPEHYAEFEAYKKRCQQNNWNPVWVQLCDAIIALGLRVSIYDSKSTVSKYIEVYRENHKNCFKIRISNHAPVRGSRNFEPSDFYVGANFPDEKWNNWKDALAKVKEVFGEVA